MMNAYIDAASALENHRWEHRLLLVFSPRADDMRARELDGDLESRACELADRDLVVGHFPMLGDARLGDQALSPESAAQIRSDFNVDFGDFVVILVGKDGYEKRREKEIPDLDAIFEQIDGMPMRRAEMRARGIRCEG